MVAVIAVLAALLLPALKQAKKSAKRAACVSNLRQWGVAFYSYAQDYNDWLPAPTLWHNTLGGRLVSNGGQPILNHGLLYPYVNYNAELYFCTDTKWRIGGGSYVQRDVKADAAQFRKNWTNGLQVVSTYVMAARVDQSWVDAGFFIFHPPYPYVYHPANRPFDYGYLGRTIGGKLSQNMAPNVPLVAAKWNCYYLMMCFQWAGSYWDLAHDGTYSNVLFADGSVFGVQYPWVKGASYYSYPWDVIHAAHR